MCFVLLCSIGLAASRTTLILSQKIEVGVVQVMWNSDSKDYNQAILETIVAILLNYASLHDHDTTCCF